MINDKFLGRFNKVTKGCLIYHFINNTVEYICNINFLSSEIMAMLRVILVFIFFSTMQNNYFWESVNNMEVGLSTSKMLKKSCFVTNLNIMQELNVILKIWNYCSCLTDK